MFHSYEYQRAHVLFENYSQSRETEKLLASFFIQSRFRWRDALETLWIVHETRIKLERSSTAAHASTRNHKEKH